MEYAAAALATVIETGKIFLSIVGSITRGIGD